jgi:hypothetical protein
VPWHKGRDIVHRDSKFMCCLYLILLLESCLLVCCLLDDQEAHSCTAPK